MDQARRWVIKYFLAYLVMLWSKSNLDHAVVTALSTHKQRFVSGVVVSQFVCRLAVDILNIIFSHALPICRLVD